MPPGSHATNQIPYALDNIVDLVLTIQVNILECGGIAIGVCISHKVADASSVVTFVNGWAAVARRDTHMVCPQFGLANIFPPPPPPPHKFI